MAGVTGVSAKDAIVQDLRGLQRERRRHFAVAFLLVLAAVATFAAVKARADLWQQPPLELAGQLGIWGLALVIYPAIGIGLIFPPRWMRILVLALGAGAVAMVVQAWSTPGGAPLHLMALDPCSATVLAGGSFLIVLALSSGAYLQRRRVGGLLWIAAAIALAGFDLVTWLCPAQAVPHVVPSHLGAAALLLAAALGLGLVARWLDRRSA